MGMREQTLEQCGRARHDRDFVVRDFGQYLIDVEGELRINRGAFD